MEEKNIKAKLNTFFYVCVKNRNVF